MGTNITVEGRQEVETDERDVNFDAVSPNYFFDHADRAGFGARIQRRRHGDEHESGNHQ